VKSLISWNLYSMKKDMWLRFLGGLLIVITFPGCAGDRYQQQAVRIKGHVEAFYDRLQSHQVARAMSENEQIEMMALRAEERLLRRVGQMDQGERIQEWKIIKTAKETAAENWLALARYFSETQQYDKALGTYRRVMENYQGSPYQVYVNRAKTGIRNVEAILDPGTLPGSPQD
jgi:tetratricopeptide (TPR) repeat protein